MIKLKIQDGFYTKRAFHYQDLIINEADLESLEVLLKFIQSQSFNKNLSRIKKITYLKLWQELNKNNLTLND